MDFHQIVRTRRSIRGYQPEPVPADVLERVLEAGRIAPSAANFQPTHFIVVRDSSTRARMKAAYDREWFVTAPVILVGCVDPTKAWRRPDGWNAADVDLAIALDHIILAATTEGLATCWVCHFDEDALKALLGIPAHIRAVAMTPIGYPAAAPRPFSRKPMTELLHEDRW